ncbi:translation initiation factor 2 [Pseudomonas sp. FW215-R2]|uniref:translation initiation factor 2 n=1 Tax=Pseudomonas TaxID=286 RepID=UPI000BD176E9|nr:MULTISPECIES: translation initiation factor 2 [Pseudomonas]PCR95124.1 translation initiation factor 2 [Pseudomonas fluorescens]PMX01024.1 translation initiation factor 2 [Pseudomonas sp. FW215-R2]PMX10776.1 translation initiation factor 2 [Pseudomonas sp. FW215-L1]PMX24830.1 translation initiation factor 2 [Pseudomonas sp. FW215-E1]PNA30763.1 translation initiation factor 2 [Pseudomonas sp. FW215-R4]
MKAIFPAAWVLLCLLMIGHAPAVMAAAVSEKPTAASTVKKPVASKKAAPAKEKQQKAAPAKKRAPIASKSKSASEVAKTPLPPARLDLSLPKDMVQQLKPVGTVPLPKREAILPQMFGEKNSGFQLNGRLLSNEMQLQLRNEERREVEGAALDFEFKQ